MIHTADFSKSQDAGFSDPLTAVLKDLDVGVLVNNVGMSYSYPLTLAEGDSTQELLAVRDCTNDAPERLSLSLSLSLSHTHTHTLTHSLTHTHHT